MNNTVDMPVGVDIQGNLIAPDLTTELLVGEIKGQAPEDFGFAKGDKLADEIAIAWGDAKAYWAAFQRALSRLPDDDSATTVTREQWVVPLLRSLGYDPVYVAKAEVVEGQTYAISHRAEAGENKPPVHIIGSRVRLEQRPPSGTPRLSAHALVQEYLNRTEHLWAIVTNGLRWRLLRDSSLMTRLTYVEFDLEQILNGENFAEFGLFYRLFHRSRLPEGMDDADECLLEFYHQESLQQGGRVRDRLRDGVESALKRLGTGFLQHPQSQSLREKLAAGTLTEVAYYRQLLMLIYRLLFLMVAESRNLLLSTDDPEKARIYREYYSIERLRALVERPSWRREGFQDLWQGLRVTFQLFDENWRGQVLGLSPLDGDLFGSHTLADLEGCGIDNHDLMLALRGLSLYEQKGQLRRVNYGALDVEELGSVYESLLEFHPNVSQVDGIWEFQLVTGSERKTTGSYYTPPELVGQLIKSALEPVIAERLKSVALTPQPPLPEGEGEQESWEIPVALQQKMQEVARVFRKEPTQSEAILWHALRGRKLENRKFRRQHPIGAFIVDFFCHEERLVIEVDGKIHEQQQEADQQRQKILESLGLRFVRVTSEAVENDLPNVLEKIIQSFFSPSPLGRGARGEGKTLQQLQETALLSLKICDPACGSGHFLLAAARRIGKELARVRTGETQPGSEPLRVAIRDVIQHCIYGVDLNPLAVDLCKVALWLEGLCQGLSLNFLDHRIKCGNSLVGVLDLDCLKDGIPEDAYKPVTGDDKTIASRIKKTNKKERDDLRQGQLSLELEATFERDREEYAKAWRDIEVMKDDDPAAVHQKQKKYERSRHLVSWLRDRSACNLWTAAFFMPLTEQHLQLLPTSGVLNNLLKGNWATQAIVDAADRLAEEKRFFHWPLEFPEVFCPSSPNPFSPGEKGNPLPSPSGRGAGGEGGFDCILGNPPWERIKLQEKEFFASRDYEIATAQNKAAREKLIKTLPERKPELAAEWQQAKHEAENQGVFIRESGRFVLTSRGDINTYAVFSELARNLIGGQGRSGIIIPTGIATDDTYKSFFGDLMSTNQLETLIGYRNLKLIFSDVHDSVKFCLFILRGKLVDKKNTNFLWLAVTHQEATNHQKLIELSYADLKLLNPNTLTCPVFRTREDAEITKKIYQRVPVLENEATQQNLWGISFMRMFDMSNDSGLFKPETAEELLPLYEAKMFWHFHHRYGDYADYPKGSQNTSLPDVPDERLQDPNYTITPRYWVSRAEVENRLAGWDEKWILGFRMISNATNERGFIAGLLPNVGCGNSIAVLTSSVKNLTLIACLYGSLSSLTFDFVCRQKMGGTNMNFFIVKQLPVLPPDRYSRADIDFIAPRVLELTYTAWDLQPFAQDMGYDGDPFIWNPERRALLRAELDAYYAHLYGLTRDELRYILDPADIYGPDFPSETFRVLKNNEMKQFGEYRTQRLVLAAWDKLGF